MRRLVVDQTSAAMALTRTAERLHRTRGAPFVERPRLVSRALLEHGGICSVLIESPSGTERSGAAEVVTERSVTRELARLSIRCTLGGRHDAPLEVLAGLACAALRESAQRVDDDIEASLLAHLRRGLRNKEIAAELGCAEVTVERHLTRLYRRFGVRRRGALLLRLASSD